MHGYFRVIDITGGDFFFLTTVISVIGYGVGMMFLGEYLNMRLLGSWDGAVIIIAIFIMAIMPVPKRLRRKQGC